MPRSHSMFVPQDASYSLHARGCGAGIMLRTSSLERIVVMSIMRSKSGFVSSSGHQPGLVGACRYKGCAAGPVHASKSLA